MSHLENLKDKLSNALQNFQNEQKERQLGLIQFEHNFLIRISKAFHKLQSSIHDDIIKIDEFEKKMNEKKEKIEKKLAFFKKNLFDELIEYSKVSASLCSTKDTERDIILGYSTEVERKSSKRIELYEVDKKRLSMNLKFLKELIASENDKIKKILKVRCILYLKSFSNEILKKSETLCDIYKIKEHSLNLEQNATKFYSSSDDVQLKSNEDLSKNLRQHLDNFKTNEEVGNIEINFHNNRIKTLFKEFSSYLSKQAEELHLHYENHIQLNNDSKIKIAEMNKTHNLKGEKYRISKSLLCLSKILGNYLSKLQEKIKEQKIDKHFLKLKNEILNSREITHDMFIEDFQDLIEKGTLENDIRFYELIKQTLDDIEKYDSPSFLKLSIQLELAKKYVLDIIELKKRFSLSKYYHALRYEDKK